MKKLYNDLPGLLLIYAGLKIFFGIILSEIFFNNYSTKNNVVSDLGRSASPTNSPTTSVVIFNGAMIVAGIAITYSAFRLIPVIDKNYITIPLIIHGIAVACVGIFPSNLSIPHTIAAITTFLTVEFVAVAAITYIGSPLSWVSAILGIFGFISLLTYPVIKTYLGDGGAERLIIYPTTLWLVIFGVYLLSIKVK